MTTRSLTLVKEAKQWTKAEIAWSDGYPEYEGVKLIKELTKNVNKFKKEHLSEFKYTIKELLDYSIALWVYVIDYDSQSLKIYSRIYPRQPKFNSNTNIKDLKEFYFIDKYDLNCLPEIKTFLNTIETIMND